MPAGNPKTNQPNPPPEPLGNAAAARSDNGEPSQMQKALELGSYFLSGCMAVNLSQFLAAPLYLVNKNWYNAWIAVTKQSFGLLTTTLTQYWAPTVVRISGDKSVRGQLKSGANGGLRCGFPDRMVLIANHQIYTDWLYLWWLAYCNGTHGHIYIVLKESLRSIPVIGWGMRLSQFIFLKRNWEEDKTEMAAHFQKLNKASLPMWLLIFPEGTNLADSTRERSAKWAEKTGIDDLQHVLLPRATGLRFSLQQMRRTVKYVYDCTIAYEGVPRGQYAQDIFTVRTAYFEGKPPKSVNMYWRRFALSSIPIDDPVAFEVWLRARWMEKDGLIEAYHRNGRFPADRGAHKTKDGKVVRGAGHIESEIKSNYWYEFLQIFAPVGVLGLVLYTFYNALPSSYTNSLNKENVMKSAKEVQKTQASLQRRRLGTNSGTSTPTEPETIPAKAMTMYNGLSQNPALQTFAQLPELTPDALQQALRNHQPALDTILTQKDALQDMKSRLPPRAALPFFGDPAQTEQQLPSKGAPNAQPKHVKFQGENATQTNTKKTPAKSGSAVGVSPKKGPAQNQVTRKPGSKQPKSSDSTASTARTAPLKRTQLTAPPKKPAQAQESPQRVAQPKGIVQKLPSTNSVTNSPPAGNPAPRKLPDTKSSPEGKSVPQKVPDTKSPAGKPVPRKLPDTKSPPAEKPVPRKLPDTKAQAPSKAAPKLPGKAVPATSKPTATPKRAVK